MKNYILLVAIFPLVFACKNKRIEKIESINGIWESIGSGWVLEIEDSTSYKIYDITSISCLPKSQGKFNEIEKYMTIKNDTLSYGIGVITYQFSKTSKLPKLCQNLINEKDKNPIYNFDVFAENVKEHYAFFELNNIDWDNLYHKQKRRLNENSTDIELYKVIQETLDTLNDNHAFLEATSEVEEAIEKSSISENIEVEELEDLPEYGDFQVAQKVAEHHLKEEMTRDSWLIQWGKLTDKIGFIQVKSMWLYGDIDVPKDRIDEIGYVDAYVETFHKMYEADYIQKEVEGVSKIMDNVMNDLSEMEAMVIDVRFNGGGQDAVSFEILSRFILESKIQIATQQLRYGSKRTNVLPLYIKGTNNAFTKPIYILTSQQTGSAAEAFSIATIAMDNVQRIGSKTSGAMSTALEKTLPNGWSFAISNEIYMDNDGVCYENIGIPVDYNLNYPKDRQTFFRNIVNALESDKQNILNAINNLK